MARPRDDCQPVPTASEKYHRLTHQSPEQYRNDKRNSLSSAGGRDQAEHNQDGHRWYDPTSYTTNVENTAVLNCNPRNLPTCAPEQFPPIVVDDKAQSFQSIVDDQSRLSRCNGNGRDSCDHPMNDLNSSMSLSGPYEFPSAPSPIDDSTSPNPLLTVKAPYKFELPHRPSPHHQSMCDEPQSSDAIRADAEMNDDSSSNPQMTSNAQHQFKPSRSHQGSSIMTNGRQSNEVIHDGGYKTEEDEDDHKSDDPKSPNPSFTTSPWSRQNEYRLPPSIPNLVDNRGGDFWEDLSRAVDRIIDKTSRKFWLHMAFVTLMTALKNRIYGIPDPNQSLFGANRAANQTHQDLQVRDLSTGLTTQNSMEVIREDEHRRLPGVTSDPPLDEAVEEGFQTLIPADWSSKCSSINIRHYAFTYKQRSSDTNDHTIVTICGDSYKELRNHLYTPKETGYKVLMKIRQWLKDTTVRCDAEWIFTMESGDEWPKGNEFNHIWELIEERKHWNMVLYTTSQNVYVFSCKPNPNDDDYIHLKWSADEKPAAQQVDVKEGMGNVRVFYLKWNSVIEMRGAENLVGEEKLSIHFDFGNFDEGTMKFQVDSQDVLIESFEIKKMGIDQEDKPQSIMRKPRDQK